MSVEFDPTLTTPIAPAEGPGRDGAQESARAAEGAPGGDVSVRFRVDRETDTIVVSVVNEATGEVVRQIPAEEQLAIEAHLRALQGFLFSRTA